MSYLKKEISLFQRDNSGNLLPVEVELEDLEDKPKVKVIPLTKGELVELQNLKPEEQDIKIILEKCIEPKFTAEELKDLKPYVSSAIVTAISAVSLGLSPEDFKEKFKNKTTQDAPFLGEKKNK